MATHILLDQNEIRLPLICPNCQAPAEVQVPFSASKKSGVLKRTISFYVPYCRKCISLKERAERVDAFGKVLGLATVIAGWIFLLKKLSIPPDHLMYDYIDFVAVLALIVGVRLGWGAGGLIFLKVFSNPREIKAIYSAQIVPEPVTLRFWLSTHNKNWASLIDAERREVKDMPSSLSGKIGKILWGDLAHFLIK